jgi:hypothetical protein
VITSAVLCPAPPLLARELTGSADVVPELRQACRDGAAELVRLCPDLVIVVGAGEQTRTWDDNLRLNLASYAPALGPAAGPTSPDLPLPLGLGARLLDEAGYTGPRAAWSVGGDEPPGRCADLGARIASAAGNVALLVMADGSARRSTKAPGYFDERSIPFDAEFVRAVRDADLDALLAVDPGLARELMATGRPCWQVLAGALRGTEPAADIRYSDDPFGVAYLVASFTVAPLPVQHPPVA